MIRTSVKVTGGHRVRAHIRNTQRKGPKAVDVGFFPNSKYPDGTYVSSVAMFNNYGTDNIPARPFFDQFSEESQDIMRDVAAVSPPVMDGVANQLANELEARLRQIIRDWTEPPNAPSTIAKKGRDEPLVDTELMLNSVDHRVED